jgi:hypothetical protein
VIDGGGGTFEYGRFDQARRARPSNLDLQASGGGQRLDVEEAREEGRVKLPPNGAVKWGFGQSDQTDRKATDEKQAYNDRG